MQSYIFVVHTNKYAGNFEREMCAFITGIVGDCGVGQEEAELCLEQITKKQAIGFEHLLEQRTDGNCNRPCKIWQTRGWLWDGCSDAVPESEFVQEIADQNYRRERMAYWEQQIARLNSYDLNDPSIIRAGWTKESKERELADYHKQKAEAGKAVCNKSMPYNSVAIFLSEKPTKAQIALMMKRAKLYAAQYAQNISLRILCFDLLKEETITTTVQTW